MHDPLADKEEAAQEYDIQLHDRDALTDLNALLLAVPHRQLVEGPVPALLAGLRPGGILVDVRSALTPGSMPDGIVYWSL